MPQILNYLVKEEDLTHPRVGIKRMRERVTIKTDELVDWVWLQNQPEVPDEGTESSTYPQMYVESRRPKHVSRLIWHLDVEYTSVQGEALPENPVARPAIITFNTQTLELPAFRDYQGRPTTNTAGEFVPGLTRRIGLIEYRVRKNVAADPEWLETHLESINSNAVELRGRTRPAKSLALGSVSGGEYRVENNQRFCELEYTLLYNPIGWVEEFFNMGTVQLVRFPKVHVNSQGELVESEVWQQVPIMVGRPQKPTEEPVPLDLDGLAIVNHLEPGTEHPIDLNQLVKIKFEIQKQLPFTGVLPLI